MVPFFVHFFDENGRKITPRILCLLAERENGIGNVGYMGLEKTPIEVRRSKVRGLLVKIST